MLSELYYRSGDIIDSYIKDDSNAFTSKCPKNQQPIPISNEEVNSYKELLKKDVGGIEANNEMYNFACV